MSSGETIGAPQPRVVVAGQKRPELPDDDLQATLGFTRSSGSDAPEVVREVLTQARFESAEQGVDLRCQLG